MLAEPGGNTQVQGLKQRAGPVAMPGNLAGIGVMRVGADNSVTVARPVRPRQGRESLRHRQRIQGRSIRQ